MLDGAAETYQKSCKTMWKLAQIWAGEGKKTAPKVRALFSINYIPTN